MSRQSMSPAERELRSQLTRLLHDQPIARGTLTVRKITCGNPNCRCAKGQKHVSLYLSHSEGGSAKKLFVPKGHGEKKLQFALLQFHRPENRKLLTNFLSSKSRKDLITKLRIKNRG